MLDQNAGRGIVGFEVLRFEGRELRASENADDRDLYCCHLGCYGSHG